MPRVPILNASRPFRAIFQMAPNLRKVRKLNVAAAIYRSIKPVPHVETLDRAIQGYIEPFRHPLRLELGTSETHRHIYHPGTT